MKKITDPKTTIAIIKTTTPVTDNSSAPRLFMTHLFLNLINNYEHKTIYKRLACTQKNKQQKERTIIKLQTTISKKKSSK